MNSGTDPISYALQRVGRTGGVDPLVATPTQRAALSNALLQRRLIWWNRRSSRYELTREGRRYLAKHAPAPIARARPRAKRGMLERLTIRVGTAACAIAAIG